MENQDILQNSETKPCPFCAETIHINAKKCKHCGEFLDTQRRVPPVQAMPNNDANQILILGGGALLILGIFFPWIDIFFGRLSPVAVLELLSKERNFFGRTSGDDGQMILFGIFCLFIPAISGGIALALALNPNKDTKERLTIVTLIATVVTLFIFFLFVLKINEGSRDGVNPFPLIGTGWYITLVGCGLLALGIYKKYHETSNPTQKTNYNPPVLTEAEKIRRAEMAAKRQAELAESRAKQAVFEQKVKKHAPKVIASVLGVGGLIWLIVYLITPNPVKEGEKAAKIHCQCMDAEQGIIAGNFQNIIASIDKNGFKSKAEARAKKESVDYFSTNLQGCFMPTYDNLKSKFSDDFKKQQAFEDAFQHFQCNNPNEAVLNTTRQQLDNKILTIKDAEPDTSAIKYDLVDQDLYRGFMLNSTYDINSLQIVKTIRAQGRIAFDYIAVTKGFQEAETSIWKGTITYVDRGSSWFRESIVTKGLNLFYDVTPDRWRRISPIPDVAFKISDKNKIILTNEDFWITAKYAIGPDVPSITLPPTNSGHYNIASRESGTASVEFIYDLHE